MRAWTCSVKYEGKNAFTFGTIWVRRQAGDEEVRQEIVKELDATFPPGYVLGFFVPGMLVLHPGDHYKEI